MTTTTCPTEINFFANHSTDSLRSLVETHTTDGRWIAINSGPDHPLAVENLRIANAAWGQLVLRGEA